MILSKIELIIFSITLQNKYKYLVPNCKLGTKVSQTIIDIHH